jgi:uncharacterized protein (TIGR02466 family)
MVAAPLRLTPVFAVPFLQARLNPCQELNQALESLFLEHERAEFRNPTPSHIPQAETFESRFNLFRWPQPCIQELRRFVLDSVAAAVLQTTTVSAAELSRLRFHNHTWFHITRYAGSFVAHNHPMASWSAVYCVREGEKVKDHPQSGLLRFFDPRHGANGYLDPANDNLHAPFALRSLDIRLSAGDLVVFPSYLFHEVTPFYGTDTRITVAANCWFTEG